MTSNTRNIAASIHGRLLNLSRKTGEDFQFLLHRYAGERFLYRLGKSAYRQHYILKGAMLFALWGGSAYRPTRDLDFTGYGENAAEGLIPIFREICAAAAEDDGLIFDGDTLSAEPIRDNTEYRGLRMKFKVRLGNARIDMLVDVGFGNAIEPPPQDVEYPVLLNAPAPNIRAYPHEAVVAEKFHALVMLGERTSRMKDFYDLHALAAQFSFDGATLTRSIKTTFERRRTPIAGSPAALAPRFYKDTTRAQYWRGYLTRNSLPGAPIDFPMVGERLIAFLEPLWEAMTANASFGKNWKPGGPWKSEEGRAQ